MRAVGIGALVVLVVLALGLLFGAYSLAQQQVALEGYRGDVWTQVDRASQLLERLEGQLEYGVKELSQINEQIVTARSDILAAQKAKDLEAALAATDQAQLAIDVMIEAYPQYFDMTEVFEGLQDETAGSFNRITYARKDLIDAQVRFNQTRITFFPLAGLFDREEVIGSGFDPTSSVAPSTLGGQ